MALITRIAPGFALNLKLPSAAVFVPFLAPLILTYASGMPAPFASVILPRTSIFCAQISCTEKINNAESNPYNLFIIHIFGFVN